MIAFIIDELTPCLTDALTGETFQTEVVELKRKSFLSKFNADTGWYVDWGAFPVGIRVFALVLKGTMDIQGLIAVSPNASKDTRALHIHWACTAPHNNIWEYGVQKYKGVGGHLFAIAADLSFQYGFDGYVYGEAMDEDILNYYIEKFDAQPLPKTIHPYALMINGDNMRKIMEVYDYVWSDETL